MNKSWISLHIFYHSNTNPLLLDCVQPLIKDLRHQNLIQRYFFIKYWLAGPHVRLRLLPCEEGQAEEVRGRAVEACRGYLQRRPSLIAANPQSLQTLYKNMFMAEYGQDKWDREYGKDGEMPFQPNNSFAFIDYEPEYGRYGGPEGVALAEWHFEYSSDAVLKLIRETNVHVHSILLGQAAQLMLPFCYIFLRDDQKVIAFLDRYMRYWQNSFQLDPQSYLPLFDRQHAWTAPHLSRMVETLRRSVLLNAPEDLTPFEYQWYRHVHDLRQRVIELAERRALVFAREGGQAFQPEDLDGIYQILLTSYLHMTNNRLGAGITDEVYLAYVLKRCLLSMTASMTASKEEVFS